MWILRELQLSHFGLPSVRRDALRYFNDAHLWYFFSVIILPPPSLVSTLRRREDLVSSHQTSFLGRTEGSVNVPLRGHPY